MRGEFLLFRGQWTTCSAEWVEAFRSKAGRGAQGGEEELLPLQEIHFHGAGQLQGLSCPTWRAGVGTRFPEAQGKKIIT